MFGAAVRLRRGCYTAQQRGYPERHPEPLQVGGAGPGARPVCVVPAGPDDRRAAHRRAASWTPGIRGAGSSSSRWTSCSTSTTSRSTEELIRNFQRNPGRRSPYDLDNTAQYELRRAVPEQPLSTSSRRPNRHRSWRVQFLDGGGPTRPALHVQGRPVRSARRTSTGRWTATTGSRSAASSPSTTSPTTRRQLTSQAFSDAYKEQPTRWNGFVEDRLDLGDVVLVGGLRYDWYKTGASRPFYHRQPGQHELVPPDLHHTRASIRPIRTRSWSTDQSHDYVSPHVQVSFPVTERTNFRLSYAHQVQAPDFGADPGRHQHRPERHQHQPLLRHRPRLRQDDHLRVRHPARVQRRHGAGHLGVQQGQAVGRRGPPGVASTIRSSRRRRTSGWSPTPTSATPAASTSGSTAASATCSTAPWRTPSRTPRTPARIRPPTSTSVRGCSTPLGGGNDPPPQAILTTDQQPAAQPGRPAGADLPRQLEAGTHWRGDLPERGRLRHLPVRQRHAVHPLPGATRATRTCSPARCAPSGSEGDYNGARLPTFKHFDLRVTKGFRLGGVDLTAYVDVRNLFNFRNILQVFTTTERHRQPSGTRQEIQPGELQDYQQRSRGELQRTDSATATST